MFERNAVAVHEQGAVAVELVLDDGSIAAGKLLMPASRSVVDILNGAAIFFEFEPYDGERRFIAKSALKSVKLLAGPQAVNLGQKVRDLDGFDPHTILGVKAGADWDDIRAAYVALAKSYHPDRYANADLPPEVAAYLSGMLRRLNAAYAGLETAHQARKQTVSRRAAAVYVSAARA